VTGQTGLRGPDRPAVDPALLAEAVAFAQRHETAWPRNSGSPQWGIHMNDRPPWNRLLGPVHDRGPVSGVVRVGNQEVARWGEPQRADLTFSVAKTYLALLAGVAFDQGLLADPDEPVCARVRGIGFDDGANRRVTWTHLLQQTSEWQGSCFGVSDQVDHFRVTGYQPPRAGGSKGEARRLGPPGSWWEYNDVRINQLSLALLHLFGRPLPDVFREAITGPSGASDDWRWVGYDNSWVEVGGRRMQSVPGGSHWGGGVSIGSADQARIGQMLLDDGRVDGRQVLSRESVARMRAPCPIAPWYGFLVWLNSEGRICAAASPRAYCAIGAGASVTWIDPDRDLVAVVRWIDNAAIGGWCDALARAVPPRTRPGSAQSEEHEDEQQAR
jgi:CubicO group peptidase (beta-lactamase class C family)